MRPFLTIWGGDREALVPASDRPGVWFPREAGKDRWELHAHQGLPEEGAVCVLQSSVESRLDGGPHFSRQRRVIRLYAPATEPGVILVRTLARFINRLEVERGELDCGWSVFDHPDGKALDAADFWRLFRFPLAESVEAPLFIAPARKPEERPLYGRRSCPDPLRQYERLVDEETGKVLAR